MSYWSQFDIEELKEMQGIKEIIDDMELDQFEDDTEMDQDVNCRRCDDAGCNYCLMLEY